MKKRIMVTGAGGPAGNNFIKSLRESGEDLYIVGTDASRFHLQWPDLDARYLVPPSDDPGYIAVLNRIIDREGIDFVHPQPDSEVGRLSESRHQLHAKVLLPAAETIRTCQDKARSAEIWAESGIESCDSIVVNNAADLVLAREKLGLPFWLRASRGAGGVGSTPVEDIRAAGHWIEYWRLRGKDWTFVAHKYLPGRNFAFQSLWKDGEVVVSQVRERLEYIYPYLAPSGVTGTPALAVTVHRDDVNDIATRCVRAIDPAATGVFCVDLKEDSRGRPVPTEINAGRFFTTSYFFTRAGVNMPYIYVKMAYGEEITPLPAYNALPEGLYWIRHIDCPALLKREEELTWTTL